MRLIKKLWLIVRFYCDPVIEDSWDCLKCYLKVYMENKYI